MGFSRQQNKEWLRARGPFLPLYIALSPTLVLSLRWCLWLFCFSWRHPGEELANFPTSLIMVRLNPLQLLTYLRSDLPNWRGKNCYNLGHFQSDILNRSNNHNRTSCQFLSLFCLIPKYSVSLLFLEHTYWNSLRVRFHIVVVTSLSLA